MDRRADRRERREESSRRAALPGAGRPDADDCLEKSYRWDEYKYKRISIYKYLYLSINIEQINFILKYIFYQFFFSFWDYKNVWKFFSYQNISNFERLWSVHRIYIYIFSSNRKQSRWLRGVAWKNVYQNSQQRHSAVATREGGQGGLLFVSREQRYRKWLRQSRAIKS